MPSQDWTIAIEQLVDALSPAQQNAMLDAIIPWCAEREKAGTDLEKDAQPTFYLRTQLQTAEMEDGGMPYSGFLDPMTGERAE